jgi:hypothetical protein
MTASSVSFRVSRTGVPVLVKIPYFPNWKASGASQPVEVTPNDMVVTPTSRTVTLTYATSTVDWVGRAGSLLGLGGLVALWRPTTIPAPPPPRRRRSKTDSRDDNGPDNNTDELDDDTFEDVAGPSTERADAVWGRPNGLGGDSFPPSAYRDPQDE